jgi:hypothetical protein
VLGSAALILVGGGAVSYPSIVMSRESERWVRHTQEVVANLRNSLSDVARIESDDREVSLTNDRPYIESCLIGIVSAAKNSSATGAMNWVGQKVKSTFPKGFAERLLAEDARSAWRDKSAPRSNSTAAGMEVSF